MAGKFTSASATNTGADAVITVPANEKWRVKSIETDLNTSAVAGLRDLGIQVTVGGKGICFVWSAISLNPSNHIFFTFAPNLTTDTAARSDGSMSIGFPEIFLGPGDTLQTLSGGLKAGDVINLDINIESFLV